MVIWAVHTISTEYSDSHDAFVDFFRTEEDARNYVADMSGDEDDYSSHYQRYEVFSVNVDTLQVSK